MRYKKLQRANVEVSEIGVGTWAMGGQHFGPANRQESIKAIHKMVDMGVNLIDTAPVYGNGRAEMIVGDVLKEIPRDKVLISTKFGIVPNYFSEGRTRKDASSANIVREIERSLMNLGTDYVDFYFVHWPAVNTPIAETMTALETLRQKGAIRFIGVSNFSEEEIEEAEKYGKIDVQQPPYSMVDRSFEGLIKWGYDKGIDSFTYGSLGAGILSGAIRTMPNYGPDDARNNFYDYFREPKFSKVMELLKVLDKVAEKHNSTVAQTTLNWSTQKNYVGTALVGVRDEKHAADNCTAFDWKLDEEDIALIDAELERLGL